MIKEIQDRERRRAPRIILRRAITYEPGVLPLRGHFLTGERLRGSLVDISNGGICFKTEHELQEKMVLKVNLPVSEISPAVPALAQVSWIRKGSNRKEYRVGLKFII